MSDPDIRIRPEPPGDAVVGDRTTFASDAGDLSTHRPIEDDRGRRKGVIMAFVRHLHTYKQVQEAVRERHYKEIEIANDPNSGTRAIGANLMRFGLFFGARPALFLIKWTYISIALTTIIGTAATHRFSNNPFKYPGDIRGIFTDSPEAEKIPAGQNPLDPGDGLTDGRAILEEAAKAEGERYPLTGNFLETPIERAAERDAKVPIGGGDLIAIGPQANFNPSSGQYLRPNLYSYTAGTAIITDIKVQIYDGKVVVEGTVVDELGMAGNNPANNAFKVGDRIEVATPLRTSSDGSKYRVEVTTRSYGAGDASIPMPRESGGAYGEPLPSGSGSAPVAGYAVSYTHAVAPTGMNRDVTIALEPLPQLGLVAITRRDGSAGAIRPGEQGLNVRWDEAAVLQRPPSNSAQQRLNELGINKNFGGQQPLYGSGSLADLYNRMADTVGRRDISNPQNDENPINLIAHQTPLETVTPRFAGKATVDAEGLVRSLELNDNARGSDRFGL